MNWIKVVLPKKWYEKSRLIKLFKEVTVVFFFQLVFLRMFELLISNEVYLYLLSITAGGVLHYFFRKFERSEKIPKGYQIWSPYFQELVKEEIKKRKLNELD